MPGTIITQQPIRVMVFNFIQKSRKGKENVHLSPFLQQSYKSEAIVHEGLCLCRRLLIDKRCPIFTRRFKIFLFAEVCSEAAGVLKNLIPIWKVLLFRYLRVKHHLQVSKERSENVLELKAFVLAEPIPYSYVVRWIEPH